MHPRCAMRSIRVPTSLTDLESEVRSWISTCVMSRTEWRGVAMHREVGLVTGNDSLRVVWNRLQGRGVEIARLHAEYLWGANRVEKIVFTLVGDVVSAPPPESPRKATAV